MLLSDPTVKTLLREDLVPCWESVQDTAKVTISFADGKTLKRTIGGNTVIYLCRPDGGVVDAFPGVYTPKDFHHEAQVALAMLKAGQAATSDDALVRFHRNQLLGHKPPGQENLGSTTFSKRVVESPIRNGLRRPNRPAKANRTQAIMPLNGVGSPLRDVSKYAANARQIRRDYLGDHEREQLSPQAFGQRMVGIDSNNNRLIVRPRVHKMMAATARAMTPSEWQLPMFEGLLNTDLGDPYLGLTDAIVPGTGDVGR